MMTEKVDRLLMQNDTDRDGKLGESELPSELRGQLQMWDANGDGSLDRLELEKMYRERSSDLGKQ